MWMPSVLMLGDNIGKSIMEFPQIDDTPGTHSLSLTFFGQMQKYKRIQTGILLQVQKMENNQLPHLNVGENAVQICTQKIFYLLMKDQQRKQLNWVSDEAIKLSCVWNFHAT